MRAYAINLSPVAARGLEPRRLAEQDPKSCVSANFTKRPAAPLIPAGPGNQAVWILANSRRFYLAGTRNFVGFLGSQVPGRCHTFSPPMPLTAPWALGLAGKREPFRSAPSTNGIPMSSVHRTSSKIDRRSRATRLPPSRMLVFAADQSIRASSGLLPCRLVPVVARFCFACLRRPVIVGARPLRPKALGPDDDGLMKAESKAELPGLPLQFVRNIQDVIWLCSRGASYFIGHVLIVDGCMTVV